LKSRIVEKIIQIKENSKVKPRNLSSRVGSRWYRAPEICLIEK